MQEESEKFLGQELKQPKDFLELSQVLSMVVSVASLFPCYEFIGSWSLSSIFPLF